MPFSRGSSRPGDRTRVPYVSCIGRRVLYHQCPLWGPTYALVFIFQPPLLLPSHLSDFRVWGAQDLENSGLSCLPHSILVTLSLPYTGDPVFISHPLPSSLPPIPIYKGLLNIFTQISNSHLKFSKIKPEL